MRHFSLICCLILPIFSAKSQAVIKLLNPSFEFDTYNRPGQVPILWMNYGAEKESPTDLQPGHFNCFTEPFDGHSYVGMVVRDNGTSEAIGQKLEKPLLAGNVYRLSVAVAQSKSYISNSRKTGENVNYVEPVLLRILGFGQTDGSLPVVLAQTTPVINNDWEMVELDLKITEFDCHLIVFQAVFAEADKFGNGNLLLDQISDIVLLGKIDSLDAKTSIAGQPVEPANFDSTLEKKPIFIQNPSFEKLGFGGAEYSGWGFMVRNYPIPERCALEAVPPDGERFLVLTTSANQQFAKIMTKLERQMRRGVNYQLSFQVSHCKPKRKPLRLGGEILELADHKGCYLRIYGVDGKSGKQELLAFIGPVTNPDWAEITVDLSPKNSDVHAIILQAWNDQNLTGSKTRHIFLDNLSPLVPIF